jgi:hypothetical protein
MWHSVMWPWRRDSHPISIWLVKAVLLQQYDYFPSWWLAFGVLSMVFSPGRYSPYNRGSNGSIGVVFVIPSLNMIRVRSHVPAHRGGRSQVYHNTSNSEHFCARASVLFSLLKLGASKECIGRQLSMLPNLQCWIHLLSSQCLLISCLG